MVLPWRWSDGVALALEHCDSGLPAEQTQKGFLGFEEELSAVESIRGRTGTRLGLAVNWGRSAIEARGPVGPLRQIRVVANASSLLGIVFSGAASSTSIYGSPFADVHPPLHGTGPGHAPESLMTEAAIRECVAAGGEDLLYRGVKVAADPGQQELEARLLPVIKALEAVNNLHSYYTARKLS